MFELLAFVQGLPASDTYTVQQFAGWFVEASATYGLNPIIMAAKAIIENTSGFNYGLLYNCNGQTRRVYNYFSVGFTGDSAQVR